MSKSTPAARHQRYLQARRDRAVRLFEQGKTQAEVVRRLGISATSVSRWYQVWGKHGAEGLRAAKHFGRPSRLDASELAGLEAALLEGPGAHGFATELWTLPRVAELIKREFGVRYHQGHVWRVMRKLGWSLQRPTTRARERDEDAIAHWKKKHWPKLKKGAQGR